MATTPRNAKYRVVDDVMIFAAASGTVFNEGDLVYLDTGTGLIAPISTGTQVPFLLGDVQGTQPTTNLNGQQFTNTFPVYVGRHTVKMFAKDVGNFVSNATPVYFNGGDAQSFYIASGTDATAIGTIAVNPKENGGVPSGTTVIGKEYEVLLRKSYAFNI